MEWRERDGVRWLEAELPGAMAAFTTREGGTSRGPFASLNLGYVTGDEHANVADNRNRMAAALALEPRNVLMGFQVHGADVVRHEARSEPPPFLTFPGDPAQVDGHATSVAGLAPLVLVADCLPVALAGPGGVAMLHCGWRGLAGGIVARGVREVEAQAAAIGPGIGPCCFEVGEEVLSEFGDLGPAVARGRMLDLPEVASRQLTEAGVAEVERAELCTSCHPELFFSHRRDNGDTGRQGGLIISRLNNAGASASSFGLASNKPAQQRRGFGSSFGLASHG